MNEIKKLIVETIVAIEGVEPSDKFVNSTAKALIDLYILQHPEIVEGIDELFQNEKRNIMFDIYKDGPKED